MSRLFTVAVYTRSPTLAGASEWQTGDGSASPSNLTSSGSALVTVPHRHAGTRNASAASRADRSATSGLSTLMRQPPVTLYSPAHLHRAAVLAPAQHNAQQCT